MEERGLPVGVSISTLKTHPRIFPRDCTGRGSFSRFFRSKFENRSAWCLKTIDWKAQQFVGESGPSPERASTTCGAANFACTSLSSRGYRDTSRSSHPLPPPEHRDPSQSEVDTTTHHPPDSHPAPIPETLPTAWTATRNLSQSYPIGKSVFRCV